MYHEFSLQEGIPIGVIQGGQFDKQIIHIKQSNNNKKNQQFIINDTDKGKIKPLYYNQVVGDELNKKEYPNRYIIAGASLCGKSHMAKEIAEDYFNEYKNDDRNVILFSGVTKETDEIFACKECKQNKNKYNCFCHNIKRIKLDDELLNNPIELKELENSIVIFDDVDRLPNQELTKYLNLLRDNIMKSGRHNNISVISISQNLLEGSKSKTSNNNAFTLIGFPHLGGKTQLYNYLLKYACLSKPIVEKIMKLPSRWIILNNVTPMFVLYVKGAFII